MSDSKKIDDGGHTPGPWAVTGVSMTTGNVSVGMKEHRIVIAEVTNAASFGDMLAGAMKRGGGGFQQNDCHTQFANARLIAAAPDLHEHGRKLAAEVGGLKAFEHEIRSVIGNTNWSVLIDRLVGMDLAIAKAEGRAVLSSTEGK